VKLDPTQILIAPVVSEKSYHMINGRQYCFRVHQDAHKLQVRQAVEAQFDVKVESVNIVAMPSKPKRRGASKGRRPGWKKAIVKLQKDYSIEIFQSAQV
jgi:large subunit ribosomal protein L23